jgi:caffeoyl-CoA O-methyltransferase
MDDRLLSTQLREYLDTLVPPRTGEMQKMEEYAREQGFPIIGPTCGYLCYQIARMIGATKVFEMGSGFGYSTAWFARAVQENGGGRVHHVVWDEGLSQQAQGHLNRLGFGELVYFQVGEAVQTLRDTNATFDLIFNDIDKEGYPDSLSVISERLRPGGVLVVDNVLWSGRVFDDQDTSPSTEGIREITRRVVSDPRWISTVIPIRDGLLVAYKR